MDSTNGKVVYSVPVGEGVDATSFDPQTKLAFTSNGGAGTVTVAHEDSPSLLKVVQTIKTVRGARTMTLDPATHTIYLAATDYEPQAPGSKDRPKAVAGTLPRPDVSDEVKAIHDRFHHPTGDRRPARRSAGDRATRAGRRARRCADDAAGGARAGARSTASSSAPRSSPRISPSRTGSRRKAALLPSISGFGQYIYTQPNGTPSGVWVPNDGPNIYAMWLNVHGDIFSLQKWSEYKSAAAAEAVARAKADVAARGLVATIVQNYYGLVAAQRKAGQRAAGPARGAAVPRHHQEAGGRRRGRALRRDQGADSGRAAEPRRAGRGARRAQEPARRCRC